MEQTRPKELIGSFARRHGVSSEYVRRLDSVLQPERVNHFRIYGDKQHRIMGALRKGAEQR